jgi:hypothetical protein
VTLFQATAVDRRDRAFASAVTMIWTSVLTAGAVSMSVVIPRGQEHSGLPSVYRGRKERGPFSRAPSDSIRNLLLANTDANWRKLT